MPERVSVATVFYHHLQNMPLSVELISPRVMLLAVSIFLLAIASPGASLDVKETTLSLEEGSTLNYSTGVETSSPLQSLYVCITKNVSATYTEALDLNTTLSIGDCVVCDSGQNCAHQFNSSAINVTISLSQNDSVQLVNLFKENISFDDDGTRIVCAYEAGNITMPHSWIYLDVHSLPKPENPINTILVPVAVLVIALLFVILLIVAVIAVVIIICGRKRSKYSFQERASRRLPCSPNILIDNGHISPSGIHEPSSSTDSDDYCSFDLYDTIPEDRPEWSSEPVTIHIDWPNIETQKRARADTKSDESGASEARNKLPDLPDRICSRDDSKQ